MKAKKLFNYIKVKQIKGIIPDIKINKITQDTREVEQGDVFLCIEGSDFDGHLYAQKAINSGAIVIVAQKEITADVGEVPVVYVNDTRKMMAILAAAFYNHPSEELTVIGVTGTNGKTTVTYLIDAICKAVNKKTGLVGTIEMHIDDE
ncbi:MAG: Mur ligase domain-containing protein, partial [Vagococcus sp.]|nr:Mur ligase domain-containing protein [Vagococcus sp.]